MSRPATFPPSMPFTGSNVGPVNMFARERISDLCLPPQLFTSMCLLHSNLTDFLRSCCAGSPEAEEQGTPHCWPHGPGKGPSPLKTSAGGPASLSIGTWVPTAGLQSADIALSLSLTNVWHIGPAAHKTLTIARQQNRLFRTRYCWAGHRRATCHQ